MYVRLIIDIMHYTLIINVAIVVIMIVIIGIIGIGLVGRVFSARCPVVATQVESLHHDLVDASGCLSLIHI